MLAEIFPMLLVGFGLGALHALDADHVMAVSALSNEKPGLRKTAFQSLHWALGHGGVLLVSGALLFGLGVAIPEPLQHVAEASVGVLLIVLGLACFWQLRKDRIQLQVHSHGDIEHTHLYTDGHDGSLAHADDKEPAHKPVFVGILHGLAGSAPALALIPAVAQGELLPAMTYLLIFSLGVMLSMMAFGLGFAKIQDFLKHNYARVFTLSRHVLAYASIFLGGFWLYQSV